MRGRGRTIFVAILLMVAGVLNVVYGIAALSDSHLYSLDETYLFSNVDTWGWVTIVLGAIQLLAAISLFAGGFFGIIVGIFSASLAAIGALVSIDHGKPWWSLAVFALCLIILHGLIVYGEDEAAAAS